MAQAHVCDRCGSTYETAQEAGWWIADDERSAAGGIQCGCRACKGMSVPQASDFRTERQFKAAGPSGERRRSSRGKSQGVLRALFQKQSA